MRSFSPLFLSKSPDIIPEQRRGHISSAIGYAFLVIPLLIFQILLTNRLDGDNHFKYTAITVPLFISLITLICLSFGAKGGNCWWFGIRQDFCQVLLGVCPFLQEYGNISYSLHRDDTDDTTVETGKIDMCQSKKQRICEQPTAVVPVISIETPD